MTQSSSTDFKRMNVLITDDKPNMRRTIKNMLRQLGFEQFVEADDGDTAIEKLQSEKVDLILCDWNMPRVPGIGVLKAVREDPRLRQLPFVMVTAEMDEGTVAEAGESEIDAYVLKPFTPALLQEKINEAIEKHKNISPLEMHFNQGLMHLNLGEFDDAVEQFDKALVINPKSPRALWAKATALEHLDKIDEAIKFHQAAIKLAPQFVRAHESLAEIYRQRGETKKSAAHLETAVIISPKNLERQVALGQSLAESGQTEKATAVFHKVLKSSKDDHELATKVGESLLSAGMAGEAQKAFQQGLDANPSNIHLYNRLGIAFRKQGKFKEAIDNYRRALSIDSRNAALYYNLSRAYLESGDRTKAIGAVKTAIKMKPGFKEALILLEKLS